MRTQVNLILAAALLWTLAAGSEETTVRRLVGLEYPPIAAQAQIQGKVVLTCVLGSDGRVRSTEVRSGQPVLSEAARANASKWTFHVPAGVRPEARFFTLTYDFRLEGICHAPNCTSSFSFETPDSVTVVTQARHWNPAAAYE